MTFDEKLEVRINELAVEHDKIVAGQATCAKVLQECQVKDNQLKNLMLINSAQINECNKAKEYLTPTQNKE